MIIRPEVKVFAEKMEYKLSLNDSKDHWCLVPLDRLIDGMMSEIAELLDSIKHGDSLEEIAFEAADVANFAMMIADNVEFNYGGVNDKLGKNHKLGL